MRSGSVPHRHASRLAGAPTHRLQLESWAEWNLPKYMFALKYGCVYFHGSSDRDLDV
jgi:hypothetical protein